MKHKSFFGIAASVALLVLAVAVGVQATTRDLTVGGTVGYAEKFAGKTFLIEKTVVFSGSSVTGTAADVYQLFNVPAGTFVLAVGYEVDTGEDGTCTMDIGDGDDTDGYFDGANIETGATATAVTEWSSTTTASAPVTNIIINTITLPALTNVAINLITMDLTNMADKYSAADITVVSNATLTSSWSTNAFMTNIPVTTQTVYPVIVAPSAYANGRFYAATDTIDLLLNNDADAATVTVRALVMPVGGME